MKKNQLLYKWLPGTIDSNACHCLVLGFRHRTHKSALRHFGIYCPFVRRNIAP